VELRDVAAAEMGDHAGHGRGRYGVSLLLPVKYVFARSYGFVSADCAVAVGEAAANFAALKCWSPST
jgi:hypothetical protein